MRADSSDPAKAGGAEERGKSRWFKSFTGFTTIGFNCLYAATRMLRMSFEF
jgi:hypothetical protein